MNVFKGIENNKELAAFSENLTIRIHLKPPNYKDILTLQPKERIKVIRQRKRAIFKEFITKIGKKDYKRLGSKLEPSGLEINCTKKEILRLNKEERIEHISILNPPINNEVNSTSIESYYFAIKARFAIQIENRTKGLQSYEDRILLIKAISSVEAEQKLKKGFKEYEQPYLNIYGELVRWKFEKFIDCYETTYSSLEEMMADENKGIEVFSLLKNRRLNPERIWNRLNDK